MTILLTLLGIALILVALRDIFHELFHPSGRGTLSRAVMRILWRVFRGVSRRWPALLDIAGPSMMPLIILCWAALLSVGWALVLWPHMPGSFLLSTGLEPTRNSGFLDALYLSLTTLSTLGYGDIAPKAGALRMLMPLEALFGFALLTASISWVLSIYPVLGRRRSLAQRIRLLSDAESATGVTVERADATQLLSDLTSQLTMIDNDLLQFPITYYFHAVEEKNSLSAVMPYLIHLSNRLGGPELPTLTRLHAAMLGKSVEDFSSTLARLFPQLSRSSPEAILEAYARDHLHTPQAKSRVDE